MKKSVMFISLILVVLISSTSLMGAGGQLTKQPVYKIPTWWFKLMQNCDFAGCMPGNYCGQDSRCHSIENKDHKEWTIMVYMNADDDSLFPKEDLEGMVKESYDKNVNIVVMYDGQQDSDSVIYYISNGKKTKVRNELFADGWHYFEAEMEDQFNMADFVAWSMEKYPAEKYFLDIWNHGFGWVKVSGISVYKGYLEEGLKEIQYLNGAQKLDVIGFDACLMGMWEVADVVEPYADYMVASIDSEEQNGFNYEGFLREMENNDSMSPEELCSAIVDVNNNYTLSCLDLDKHNEVTAKLDEFARIAIDYFDDTNKINFKTNFKKMLTQTADMKADYPVVLISDEQYHMFSVDLGSFVQQMINWISDRKRPGNYTDLYNAAIALRNEIGNKKTAGTYVVNNKVAPAWYGSKGVAINFQNYPQYSRDYQGHTPTWVNSSPNWIKLIKELDIVSNQ